MYVHGSTFGGHPVATAVAVANMTAMRDEDVFGRVLHAHLGMPATTFDAGAGLAQVRQRVATNETIVPDDFQIALVAVHRDIRRSVFHAARLFAIHFVYAKQRTER